MVDEIMADSTSVEPCGFFIGSLLYCFGLDFHSYCQKLWWCIVFCYEVIARNPVDHLKMHALLAS